MNNEHLDKKRSTYAKGKEVTLRLLQADDIELDLEKVTSVAVVPFDAEGNIAVAMLDRGLDIPGGHVQKGETSLAQTASREALEEVFITLDKTKISCVIESDLYGTADDQLTYMVILAGTVKEFLLETPNEESNGRKIMSIKQFLEEYKAGDKTLMTDILKMAEQTYAQF